MKDPMTDLSMQVLYACRCELYSLFPLLDGAFASLSYSPGGEGFQSNGERLLFSPKQVTALFADCPNALRRGILHVLLHLLFLHPWSGRQGEDWDLACDLAVEQILQKEDCSRLALPEDPVRRECFHILGETCLSAEKIYGRLGDLPFSRQQLKRAFAFDDHSLWTQADPAGKELWQRVLAYGAGQGAGSGRRGSRAGTDSENLEDLHRGLGDYRAYLKQFTVAREEMELDMGEFDPIYYHLGMERYGNLPLLEPLETREGHKLQQLVIAIDTSGSCDRETVRRFLEETYSILSQRENFFRKMEVWLIQCDCLVQSVAVIHSREEWKNYSRCITIEGRGGTDFTPVFQFVDQQRSLGRLRELGALLYFTDGDGCYPREKPDYETAFVFLKETEQQVPAWARTLLVSERG